MRSFPKLVAMVWRVAVIVGCVVGYSQRARAAETRTPTEIYAKVEQLAAMVRHIRAKHEVDEKWPEVAPTPGIQPRHVFQKGLDLLSKISRYRTKVLGSGEIAVPRFPGRATTHFELFQLVARIGHELELVSDYRRPRVAPHSARPRVVRSDTEIYSALAEVSLALDPALGLRGITPNEVFSRSLQVVALAKFLRRSQNLAMNVPRPGRTRGKLPNHALAATYGLLEKIHAAQRALWMKPLALQSLPRRVIRPSDVYDAMGVALAELLLIQHRLGLERDFAEVPPQPGKRPDDVMQNALWATALLPDFASGRPIRQHDRRKLDPTTQQSGAIAHHVLTRLVRYRNLRGIRQAHRPSKLRANIAPPQVFANVIATLDKVDILRRSQHLGPLALPALPTELVANATLFDAFVRLDAELALIHRTVEPGMSTWSKHMDGATKTAPSSAELYQSTEDISRVMDQILGPDGVATTDLYRSTQRAADEARAIIAHLQLDIEIGTTVPSPTNRVEGVDPGPQTLDTARIADICHEIAALLAIAGKRAGVTLRMPRQPSPKGRPSRLDILNRLLGIEAELALVRAQLDIAMGDRTTPITSGASLADVAQLLTQLREALATIVHHTRNTRSSAP